MSNDLLVQADESAGEPDHPAWQKQEWEIAKRVVSTDRFQQLPTKFEIHEWAIMQDFSNSVASDRVRGDLLNAIHGAGAFRHFKDTLQRHQIESAWFEFRAQALRQVALDWCEEHHEPQVLCCAFPIHPNKLNRFGPPKFPFRNPQLARQTSSYRANGF